MRFLIVSNEIINLVNSRGGYMSIISNPSNKLGSFYSSIIYYNGKKFVLIENCSVRNYGNKQVISWSNYQPLKKDVERNLKINFIISNK